MGVILTIYKSWDDPPSGDQPSKRFGLQELRFVWQETVETWQKTYSPNGGEFNGLINPMGSNPYKIANETNKSSYSVIYPPEN